MKIIELKEIYDVLSDGVAGENCIVYQMVQLMYLATWKEYTTLQTLQIQVLGEIRTKLYLQRILTLDSKTL
jgi:hypothetical protein